MSTDAKFGCLLALAMISQAAPARAQACCAGSSAVTPARLGLHDSAAVGVQLRASNVFGSHDASGEYVPAPRGSSEWGFEQNVYAAARVLGRGQLGVLVPFVETHRSTRGRSETGGGLGDVNVSARYDLLLARESRLVPGIGLLTGVTLPTGRAVEKADKPLATDATGLGAVQVNGGVALEQVFGPWLVGLTGLVAYRAPRRVGGLRMALAPQYSALGTLAYVFDNGASVALSALYALEADASVDRRRVPDSSRRRMQGSISGAWPVDDQLSALGSVFSNPPVSSLGVNQSAAAGASLGVKWAFL
ncbi:MAG: transporter [Myxococcales bacterium]|nr:transporter [Myxococcales bacterium]